ncbi:MAG: riboflavin synthase [Actinomycetota bacterium]|jgi:riboflavin synthase|nr:riboflavin synthase [Actinomycetota bacterium]
MFTGIITHLGSVRRASSRKGLLELRIEAPGIARELKRGDSVAVNGVCLTATETSRKVFHAQAMGETLARSTLGDLTRGNNVNLELPARLADRLGGHLVQGHVDGVAAVVRSEDDEGARRLWFKCDDELLGYMVPKGSITIDGVSLTLVDVGSTTFQVAIIPHTLEATTFRDLRVGSEVNIEVDVIAKYVKRFVERT